MSRAGLTWTIISTVMQFQCILRIHGGPSTSETAANEEIIQLTEPRGEFLHRAYALMTWLDAWRRGDTNDDAVSRFSLRF